MINKFKNYILGGKIYEIFEKIVQSYKFWAKQIFGHNLLIYKA